MEEFVRQIIKDKGVPDGMPEEAKKQLEKDLISRAVDMVNKKLVDSMDAETLSEFEKLIDENSDSSAVQSFIDKNIEDKETLAAEALLELRVLYLGERA